VAAGADVTLVVPTSWPGGGGERVVDEPAYPVVELPVRRAGDVNRHRYLEPAALARVVREVAPDILDVHEEPVSEVARQALAVAPRDLPVCMYTAQNLDKRFPPPYSWRERQALGRIDALYPCSGQAASVARGKGFDGLVRVLPLGVDPALVGPGPQRPEDQTVVLGLVGRLVPEKGVRDAVHVLAHVAAHRPARLLMVGSGPERSVARSLAAELGVLDRLELVEWADRESLAACYRRMHVLLLPSRSTGRWVEQFGRVIVEAHGAGAVVAGYASGSIPEVAAGAAVLLPEGDRQGLAEHVVRLVQRPADWQRLRDAGLALAAARTWPAVAAAQVEMYAEVLARGPSPRRRVPVTGPDRRAAARREFGAPARALGQQRPFALPVLRDRPGVAAALGALLDATSRVTGRGGGR
jgi:glycosyltransferase involved in cell wall biosynthesis